MPSGTLTRASMVLEDMLSQDGRATSAAEITRRTGIPKSSVHRLLEQLLTLGWIVREGNLYRLGAQMYDFGISAARGDQAMAHAWPVLQDLAAHTRCVSYLGGLRGSKVAILQKAVGPNRRAPQFAVGARVPALRTSIGKVLVSAFPDAPESLAARAEATSDRLRLRNELAHAQETGIAFGFDEAKPGLGCIASAIRVHGQPIDVAIAVSGPAGAVRDRNVQQALRAAAAAIGRKLESTLPTDSSLRRSSPSVAVRIPQRTLHAV
ncbi:IclR family transcriptional regulator [Gordonia neofelifaecis]|uniref:IclR family transcriptional regulator n=1 Tax=Gordonia neofelifaecis NRRL B-59395 TaxID=644548 RepID=F1YGX6_9ACTN|nr:IclR family transcriptional regulator C-terminal domain-containing protein [Gordonia neofelifaecis]EGD56274.1 IclR family transcriptional regulator [Gordonia neofelifaecis NRRL B-59395]